MWRTSGCKTTWDDDVHFTGIGCQGVIEWVYLTRICFRVRRLLMWFEVLVS